MFELARLDDLQICHVRPETKGSFMFFKLSYLQSVSFVLCYVAKSSAFRMKQATLFGKLTKSRPMVYKNPANDYEKFVNAFVTRDASSQKTEEVVSLANQRWKEVKNNKEESGGEEVHRVCF